MIVQNLGRRIQTVGPHDRAGVVIDPHLAEIDEILERLAKRPVQQERAIDLAGNPVAEAHPQPMTIKQPDFSHAKHCQQC